MWLIYFMIGGYNPLGSDGAMKVPSNIRSERKLRELAENFRCGRAGEVYAINWTQEMSEMNLTRFTEYVVRNGRLLSQK